MTQPKLQHLTLNDFQAFAEEFKAESDRAAVILGAAKLDIIMLHILMKILKPCPTTKDELLDTDGPLGTLSAKITILHRLGVIDDEVAQSLHMIRKIRNSFAHESGTISLNSGAHKDRILSLISCVKGHGSFRYMIDTYFEGKSDCATYFRAMVALISIRLSGQLDVDETVYIKHSITIIPPGWKGSPKEGDSDSVVKQ